MIKTASLIITGCMVLSAYSGNNGLPELIVSGVGTYWQKGSATKTSDVSASVVVNERETFQTWEGFGGTFNEMGWDALQVVSSRIPEAIKLLFDAEDGANFVLGRIPMGASDYAMSVYTLAETPDDYAMEHFTIARDRRMLIPFIKAAREIKPQLYLWASPWFVPFWMRGSGNAMKSDARTLDAYALYFARFIEEYAVEGLEIKAVHVQNEPEYAQIKWGQPLLIDFMKSYLQPTFRQRGVSAEIWCGTMSAEVDTNLAIAVSRDPEAMNCVKGFGLQWNTIGVVPTLSLKGRVWQTEHRCGNYNFASPYWDMKRYDPDKAQNDHLYGEETWQLIRDWITAGVNAYCAWNMVLDTYGKNLLDWHQNALLVVDRTAKTLTATPAYYAFRHFSQYILPGAVRIGVNRKDAVAFMNPDGRKVVVLYNKTDSEERVSVGLSGDVFTFALPSHGWATLTERVATDISYRQPGTDAKAACNLTVFKSETGITIVLPVGVSGKVQLLTPGGRVLESGSIASGRNHVQCDGRTAPGVFLVRLVSNDGKIVTTERILLP